jgi:hypothetical protein
MSWRAIVGFGDMAWSVPQHSPIRRESRAKGKLHWRSIMHIVQEDILWLNLEPEKADWFRLGLFNQACDDSENISEYLT